MATFAKCNCASRPNCVRNGDDDNDDGDDDDDGDGDGDDNSTFWKSM
jgi:hypothetical protein